MKIDGEEMGRKIKALAKDSEALQMERTRVTQLTLQVTKAKEKEEQMGLTLKEATKKLQKTEKDMTKVQAERDELKRKADFLDDEHTQLKKAHAELTKKFELSEETNQSLIKQNKGYREVLVKNEAILKTQNKELTELQKRMEISKSNNDRFKEENEVLLK